ncbi:ATP-binding protein [Corynebacterium kalidii]
MQRDELADILNDLRIVGSDDRRVEVKSGVGKSIRDTLSAFSNGDGGILVVGLSEQDDFAPVPDFNAVTARDQLLSRCDEMTPVVRPDIDILPVPGGPESAQVLVAEIPELQPREKPCHITAAGQYQGSFLRSGDGDVRLRHYEIDRLLEERSQPQWDEEPVEGATRDDLLGEVVEAYLEGQRSRSPRAFRQGEETALRRLGIIRDGRPTLAALLAVGDFPQEYFPRLTVSFSVFPGSTKGEVGEGIRLVDSATCSGPIPEQVDDVVSLVARNMRTAGVVEGVHRRDLPDYPLPAVREAVVNALMHRDYSPSARGAQVQVNMYVDRLEVVSPGGLYGAVTVRSLEDPEVSSSRNQRLSALLENISFPGGGAVAENRGTGFSVMRTELEKALMPPVEVRDDLTRFTVIFRRRRVADGERHRTAKDAVREMLAKRESVSAAEVVAATGLSRSAVQKALSDLIGHGEVERTEPERSPRQRYRTYHPT